MIHFFFFKIILLVSLVKMLLAVRRPFTCAGIYSIAYVLMGLTFGVSFQFLMFSSGIVSILGVLYFCLLQYFDDSFYYWLILPIGALGLPFL